MISNVEKKFPVLIEREERIQLVKVFLKAISTNELQSVLSKTEKCLNKA